MDLNDKFGDLLQDSTQEKEEKDSIIMSEEPSSRINKTRPTSKNQKTDPRLASAKSQLKTEQDDLICKKLESRLSFCNGQDQQLTLIEKNSKKLLPIYKEILAKIKVLERDGFPEKDEEEIGGDNSKDLNDLA